MILVLSSLFAVHYASALSSDIDDVHAKWVSAQEETKVKARQLTQIRRLIGAKAKDDAPPGPTEEGVAQIVNWVTHSADANLVTIVKWDLSGVTAATQQVPIVNTAHKTPSGLWVTTLRVQGRYLSLTRFVSFAASVNGGGAALEQLHLANNNFDMLIDVFGTCKGCIDAVR